MIGIVVIDGAEVPLADVEHRFEVSYSVAVTTACVVNESLHEVALVVDASLPGV